MYECCGIVGMEVKLVSKCIIEYADQIACKQRY